MGGVNARPGATAYTIVVRGEIAPRFLAALENVSVEETGPETVLSLEAASPEELGRTLDRLGDAGIELLALRQAGA
jgi:hypothetical protein